MIVAWSLRPASGHMYSTLRYRILLIVSFCLNVVDWMWPNPLVEILRVLSKFRVASLFLLFLQLSTVTRISQYQST